MSSQKGKYLRWNLVLALVIGCVVAIAIRVISWPLPGTPQIPPSSAPLAPNDLEIKEVSPLTLDDRKSHSQADTPASRAGEGQNISARQRVREAARLIDELVSQMTALDAEKIERAQIRISRESLGYFCQEEKEEWLSRYYGEISRLSHSLLSVYDSLVENASENWEEILTMVDREHLREEVSYLLVLSLVGSPAEIKDVLLEKALATAVGTPLWRRALFYAALCKSPSDTCKKGRRVTPSFDGPLSFLSISHQGRFWLRIRRIQSEDMFRSLLALIEHEGDRAVQFLMLDSLLQNRGFFPTYNNRLIDILRRDEFFRIHWAEDEICILKDTLPYNELVHRATTRVDADEYDDHLRRAKYLRALPSDEYTTVFILLELLKNDDNAYVRSNVVRLLMDRERMFHQGVLQTVKELLFRDPSEYVRQTCLDFLEMAHGHNLSYRIPEILHEFASHEKDWWLKAHALDILSKIAPLLAFDAVVHLCNEVLSGTVCESYSYRCVSLVDNYLEIMRYRTPEVPAWKLRDLLLRFIEDDRFPFDTRVRAAKEVIAFPDGEVVARLMRLLTTLSDAPEHQYLKRELREIIKELRREEEKEEEED